MFVLTCPSCNHAARVRFARYNALATCPACNARFCVDAKTTSVDRDGSVGGPLHDLNQAPPMPRSLAVNGEPDPAAFATRRDEDDLAAEEIWEEVFGEAPAPPASVHEAPLDWKPRRRGPHLPAQVPTALVAVLMVGAAIGGALLGGVFGPSPSADSRIVEVPAEPGDQDDAADRTGTDVAAVTPTEDGTANGGGSEAGADANGGTSTTIADAGDASGNGSGASQPTGQAGRTGQAGSGGGARASSGGREGTVPTMELGLQITPRWQMLDQPRRPMHPTTSSDVLLWMPRMQRDADTGRAMFTAMFLAENDQIYQSGWLHVQLLDEQGLAFAELQHVVPALNARQGLQVRLEVPEDLDAQSSGVVAQFLPVNPVPRAVPIEAIDSLTRVHYSTDGPLLELTIVNPNDEAVTDPTVVVEVLTRDGWPVEVYRGTLRGTIEPGRTQTFHVRPPMDPETEPGRVAIRGYALRE